MALKTFDVNIIVPKEATNFVTNPSFEVDTTGYTAYTSTIARATAQSRRGIASCQITPDAGNQQIGMYYALALTSGVQYTFSVDVLDISGLNFEIDIYNNAVDTRKAFTTWAGTSRGWYRKTLTWTADASATFKFFLWRLVSADVTPFYTDGWQIEVGAQSTYLDGDMQGYVVGASDYRWNGTRHASTSWRSGQTRSGGTYVNIASYAKILSIVGLGMAQVTNIAVPSTMGGSFYQNTVPQERAFSIVGNINKAGDYALIEAARSALINAVKPDLVTVKQPLLIQIDQLDANSSPIAETLEVKASYESGLEMDGSGNAFNEKLSLNFRQWMPMIQQQGEHGQALGYQTTVANTNFLLMRSSTGTWSNMASGAVGGTAAYAFAQGNDGTIFLAGDFPDLGGAAGDNISKWSGAAWSVVGAGLNASALALAVGPDGKLYVGGTFTDGGGVAAADYIGTWDGTNWAALGAGTGGSIGAIAVGMDGTVYAGGNFTNLTDANGDYISKWTGAAWASMGTGMDGIVTSLAIGPDGTLYAGGWFTLAGGVAGTVYIAKWNGSAWLPLSTGANVQIYAMAIGPDGMLYVGGVFTSIGGVTASKVAKWNGTSWIPLGAGVNNNVNSMAFDKYGNLYVGGSFTTAGGNTLPDSVAMWNGTTWAPIDCNLPGAATVTAIFFDKANNMYLGFTTAGSSVNATITAPNVGSAVTYPVVTFTGPGTTYQLKNYTTGKSIFFNLTLLAGETATLNLDPLHVSFISSFRGSIMNAILPGSNLNWELLPGANNISAFMYGSTTAASGITMTWKDSYWSIDGAVR